MEFKLTSHLTPLEIKEWEEFVSTARYTHFFQKYSWSCFEKKETGATPQYFWCTDNNKIKALALVLRKKLPGLNFFAFEIPCGPCANDAETLFKSMQWLDTHCPVNTVHLTVWPRLTLSEEPTIEPGLTSMGFRRDNDANRFRRYHDETLILDLNSSATDIFSNFRKSTKWEIKRQEKMNVEVKIGNTIQMLDDFYAMYVQHAPKRGGQAHSKSFFHNLHAAFLTDPANGFIASGYCHKALYSTAIFLGTQNTLWYTYGASAHPKEGDLPTAHSLHWKVIQHAQALGYKSYDLGGALENYSEYPHLSGVNVFKSGFTKNYVRYMPPYTKIYSPKLMKLITLKRKLNEFRKRFVRTGR